MGHSALCFCDDQQVITMANIIPGKQIIVDHAWNLIAYGHTLLVKTQVISPTHAYFQIMCNIFY